MKILHTADWHVGKVLKNQPRIDEQKTVLRHLVRVAQEEDVDLVVVAGDLFETSAPSPQAQGLVMHTLMALRAEGRHVVVLAGNHDSSRLVHEVYRPVLGELGLHVIGTPQRPDRGGTTTIDTRSGERAVVAALPFLSHRYAVRAAEVLLHDPSRHNQDYANRVRAIISVLCQGFTPDTVNVATTHATLLGGRWGGGERAVQTLLGYEIPPDTFPVTTHYAALGHLHRYQQIDGPCPIAYSGSPIALDFGEEANEPVALVVHATPDSRAQIRPVPLVGGRPLRTLRGTLDEVVAAGEQAGEAYLRVILTQKASAGLADQVRDKLPNTLDVQIDEKFRARADTRVTRSRIGRSPTDLFADFLSEREIDDPRLGAMFAELLEEA
ncbi:exonuclease sbcCD subunit D [Actinophytocola xinjiangensis]|uniref:Nuclease SbcCD subunit D n=1 Tax=Actinophytocola xinjiangensis TaxID=485602 RepID=A0A7Z1AZB3_9PSEU|nr:exonuclease SbcCD subunit D [Actinophytocola xinjiangensis]OLF12922.1 exonuclease sbcCD subunit D [Actinophytocola xinjiangensis]